MANKFLDDVGIAYFWTKIKNKIVSVFSPNLAPIEESVATANHAAGSYVMKDGTLYKVISPIAIGEDLVRNTNIKQVSVGSELKDVGLIRNTVVIGTITVPATGYYGIGSLVPNGTVLITVRTWNTVTNNRFFVINQTNVCAEPNTTITGLEIYAWTRP